VGSPVAPRRQWRQAGGDLVQTRGLHDATQVMHKLDDPTTASTLATATGISNEDASAALADLRARVDMVRDDPARVAAEVRDFLAPYAERATQQATAAAPMAQRTATMGAWITVGAMAGVPNIRRLGHEPIIEVSHESSLPGGKSPVPRSCHEEGHGPP